MRRSNKEYILPQERMPIELNIYILRCNKNSNQRKKKDATKSNNGTEKKLTKICEVNEYTKP